MNYFVELEKLAASLRLPMWSIHYPTGGDLASHDMKIFTHVGKAYFVRKSYEDISPEHYQSIIYQLVGEFGEGYIKLAEALK